MGPDAVILIFLIILFFGTVAFFTIAGIFFGVRGELANYLKKYYPEYWNRAFPSLSFGQGIFGDPKSGLDLFSIEKQLWEKKIQFDEDIIELQNKYRKWAFLTLSIPLSIGLIILVVIFIVNR